MMKTKKDVKDALDAIHVQVSFKKDHVLLSYAGTNERIYTDSSLQTIYEKGVALRDAVLARRREAEQEAMNRRAERELQAAAARKQRASAGVIARQEAASTLDAAAAEFVNLEDYANRALLRKASDALASYDAAMMKFYEEAMAAPGHALGWSEHLFEQAAACSMATTLAGWIKHWREQPKGEPDSKVAATLSDLLNEFRKHIKDEVVRMAGNGIGRSTNPCANLMEHAELKARADFARSW